MSNLTERILNLGDDMLLNSVKFKFKKGESENKYSILSLRMVSFKMKSKDRFKISFRMDHNREILPLLQDFINSEIFIEMNNKDFIADPIIYKLRNCSFIKCIPSFLNPNNNDQLDYTNDNGPLIFDALFKIEQAFLNLEEF